MLPTLYISHGSPMLALEPGASGVQLRRLATELPRPKAILVVSAHWESDDLRVTGAAAPDIWHDFYGFPPPLYAVRYPAKGEPALAQRTIELLQAAGLPAQADPQRPFDHGTWVPLSLMYPQADIPVLQLSLPSRLGPALQSRVGQALRQLRGEGVLLIGSGSITHNLGELDWRAGPEAIAPWAREFRDWMVEKLQADDQAASRLPPAGALGGAQPPQRRAPAATVLRPRRGRRRDARRAQRLYPGLVGDGYLSLRLTGFLVGLAESIGFPPQAGWTRLAARKSRAI